jgi:hypothetical protein
VQTKILHTDLRCNNIKQVAELAGEASERAAPSQKRGGIRGCLPHNTITFESSENYTNLSEGYLHLSILDL